MITTKKTRQILLKTGLFQKIFHKFTFGVFPIIGIIRRFLEKRSKIGARPIPKACLRAHFRQWPRSVPRLLNPKARRECLKGMVFKFPPKQRLWHASGATSLRLNLTKT